MGEQHTPHQQDEGPRLRGTGVRARIILPRCMVGGAPLSSKRSLRQRSASCTGAKDSFQAQAPCWGSLLAVG